MKHTHTLVILKEATAAWEILFTSLADHSKAIAEKAGISGIDFISESNWTGKQWDMLPETTQQVLVLETDRPYLTPEEVLAALQIHESGGNRVTLFADGSGKTSNQRSGWYKREELGSSQNASTAPVRDISLVASRTQLATAGEYFRKQIIARHLEAGVHIPLDDGIMIGPAVEIGRDTEILPGTLLKGKTKIGDRCHIGPNSQLTHAIVGDNCKVLSSFIEDSTLHNQVTVGPMANIRPGSEVFDGAKIGDFVELKAARIGAKTSVAHLSYLGDCTVGEHCNFGSGTTFVNYDGSNKHHTTVGNHVFVGCHCSLIAPVTVGDDAYLAAGSVITEDVPTGALAIARSRQTIKPDWHTNKGLFRKK